MKVAILDYSTTSVFVTSMPDFDDDYNIENYIVEKLGYRLSDISWMCGDGMEVKINT